MKDNTYGEDLARSMYKLLHRHAANGYEPGDCHCAACDVIVLDLVDFFGIRKPETGVYSPAALVRAAAREHGW